jgi:hypothetical protein
VGFEPEGPRGSGRRLRQHSPPLTRRRRRAAPAPPVPREGVKWRAWEARSSLWWLVVVEDSSKSRSFCLSNSSHQGR